MLADASRSDRVLYLNDQEFRIPNIEASNSDNGVSVLELVAFDRGLLLLLIDIRVEKEILH